MAELKKPRGTPFAKGLAAKLASAKGLQTRRERKAAALATANGEGKADSLGQKLRENLACVTAGVVGLMMSGMPTSVAALGNTPDRQGFAAVLKTVAETCALVFGWDKTGADTLRPIKDIEVMATTQAVVNQQSVSQLEDTKSASSVSHCDSNK
jgi:hypothetical protein